MYILVYSSPLKSILVVDGCLSALHCFSALLDLFLICSWWMSVCPPLVVAIQVHASLLWLYRGAGGNGRWGGELNENKGRDICFTTAWGLHPWRSLLCGHVEHAVLEPTQVSYSSSKCGVFFVSSFFLFFSLTAKPGPPLSSLTVQLLDPFPCRVEFIKEIQWIPPYGQRGKPSRGN